MTTSADTPVPEIIGEHYVVERELGRGGMSTVYLCNDQRTDTRVAVKILRPEIGSKVVIERFLREIAYSAELNHPRIPKVLDSGVIGGLPYYVMTYISGESLRTRLDREKQLPISDAIDIACKVIEPTSYAHDAGIVHRDIKPENILLAPDGVYVLDFGIARAIVESGVDRLTSTGVGVGTPAYMSPEQATGDRNIDGRSDVYSIGCVLYEMIAGIPPFVGPTAQIIISRRFAAAPPPLSEFRERVPEWLETVVSHALARSPADRWPTAKRLAEALRNPASVESRSVGKEPRPWQRRSVQGLVGVAAIGAVVLAATLGRDRSSTPPAETSGLGRIVVAPLENRTGDRSLDVVGVMAEDWITEGLQQTGLVDVVPTAAALQASRFVASAAEKSNRSPNQALAVETGAGTVVGGAYYRQGDRLMFRLDVADRGGTRLVRTIADVVAPASDPTRGVEELRNRLMGWLALKYDERLLGAAPEGDQPPTYAAYQIFSEGMTKYIAGDNTSALPLFLRAYQLDSSFTVGLLYASIAATNLRQWVQADSMLKEVNSRRETLSEYNRAWLDYRLAFVRGDHEAGLAAIRIAATLAPESKAAYNRAVKANDAGYYHEALETIEALPSDRGPMRGYSPYSDVYTSVLHVLGLYDREYAVGVEAQKTYSHRLIKFTPIMRALIGQGRLDSVGVVVRAAQGIPVDPVGWDYGHLLNEVAEELGAHGYPDSAAVYFEELRKWLATNDRGTNTQGRLVRVLYSLGKFNEARAALMSLRNQDHANPEYLGMAGLLDIKFGQLNAATRVEDSLARSKGRYEFGVRQMYLARMAAARGNRGQAVARIREAFAAGFSHNLGVHRDIDFADLRDYPPFIQLLRSKD